MDYSEEENETNTYDTDTVLQCYKFHMGSKHRHTFYKGDKLMWLEIKSIITGISIIFIAIVISQILLINTLLGFLLFAAIFLMIFGDLILGMKIVDFKPIFEPTPRGWELMELELLNGRVVYINTQKGPYGKRSFRIHKEDATVINDGKSNFTLSNGNRGFRAHENFDRNIDPTMAKALQQMEGGDIREIYYKARKEVEENATSQ